MLLNIQKIKNKLFSKKQLKPAPFGYTLAALFIILGAVTGIIINNQVQLHQIHGNQNKVSLAGNNLSSTTLKQAAKSSPGKLSTGASANLAAQAATSAGSPKSTKTYASLSASSSAALPPSPSLSLYANPYSNVAGNAETYTRANPSSAGIMNRLASTPMAQWFGDFSGNISTAVSGYVAAAATAHKLPVLVAYNIPERDCGSYSSGGASSASAYQTWISQFAQAMDGHSAIVVLEPDALAGMDCLSSSDQQTREQLIAYAVQTIRSDDPASSIYIDAGNPNWQPVSVMAQRLEAADISQATGFSLNVSNFYTTAANTVFGDSLSNSLGGKHFVIDTSRNGNGPDSAGDWCNPAGRAFGQSPTLQTNSNLIDAYLWIKNPGESDGQCGPSEVNVSAPSAGSWWPQYVLMLAQNSGW